MSWITPRGSGGSFVNTTGRLTNPRTPAQTRASAGTSDGKSTVVYGVVTTAIPAATLVDPQIVTPSTTGIVQLNYNAGDAVPVVQTSVENPLLIGFAVYDSVVLDKRDDKYVVIGGTKRDGASLITVVVETADASSGRNQLVSCDATGGGFSISMPYNGASLAADDIRVGEEVGVLLAATGSGNVVTIIGDPLAAGGSGQADFTWKNGHVSSNIVLTTTGDFVRLMYTGFTSGGGGVDHWLVVSDERAHGHLSSFTATKTGAYTAIPGDSVRCDTSSNSFTVSLPAGSPNDTEISVWLGASSATTKLTVTATGTGASITAGRLPVLSSVSIELFLTGDCVRLKHISGNDWEVISSHVQPHAAEMRGSTSAGQVIANNSQTTLDMDTTVFDNAGLADLTNNRFNIRRSGRYVVSASVSWDAPTMTAGTGVAQILVRRSADSRGLHQDTIDQTSSYLQTSWVMDCAVGDTIDSRTFQNNGGNRTTSTGSPARLIVQEIL